MGILIAFIILVVLILKKVPFTVAAVVSAVIMALLSGMDAYSMVTGEYMDAAAGFVKSYFLLFLVSAIFGRIMDVSGAAYSIGSWLGHKLGTKYAIWGVSIAALVLTYGGISVFVLVFTMYPIALVMFSKANISRRLVPAAIAAGAFTAPNFLWGSPSLCNVIPADYLGTTVRSGVLVSTVCSLFYYLSSTIFVVCWNKRLAAKGEGFVATDEVREILENNEKKSSLNPLIALVPILVIVVTLNIIRLDITIAMLCGTLSCYLLFWKRIDDKRDTLIAGSGNAIASTMNTAVAVGIGGIAVLTPVFTVLINRISENIVSPYISWSVIISFISALCGSGAGGLQVALGEFAETYLAMGVDPVALHKLATAATVWAAPMPWCGAVVTLISACKLNFKEAYGPIFVIAVALAFVTMVICLGMCTVLYGI